MKRLACGIICTSVAALAMAGSASASDTDDYTALGDSYTAAPLVLPLGGPPLGCLRSAHNYPSLVKAAIGAAAFRDVSCAGATTTDMRSPQVVLGASNPPQFGALTSRTTLVTIGIGGNDVGLVGAASTCVGLGVLAPTGTACRSKFTAPGGGDLLNDRIAAAAASIATMLHAVHVLSPQARVLLVGYPDVTPRGGGCYPLVPLSDDDLAYLDEKLRATNAMLAAQAAANDAEYVDTYDDSVGHDVCTLPGTRWFEGLVPTNLAYPLHPNALGEASMARSVLRVLGQPRPGPVLGVIRRARKVIPAGEFARLRFTLSRAAGVTLTLQRSLGHGRYAHPAHGEREARRQHRQALGQAARQASRPVQDHRVARRRRVAGDEHPHSPGPPHLIPSGCARRARARRHRSPPARGRVGRACRAGWRRAS